MYDVHMSDHIIIRIFSVFHIANVPACGYSAAEMSVPLSTRTLALFSDGVLLLASPILFESDQNQTRAGSLMASRYV